MRAQRGPGFSRSSGADADVSFDVVENPSMRALAQNGVLRRYRARTLLIQEGDHGDVLYIVLAGRLRAFSDGPSGREITYGMYGPGECIGEMSLDGGPRSASVIAMEPSVCSTITRTTLRERIAADPDLALELIARVIRRARMATEHARGMAMLDVYGRLSALLESVAEDAGDGTRVIRQRVTHQLLASQVGASRVMITRLMNDLVDGGYLEVADHQIRLKRKLPAAW